MTHATAELIAIAEHADRTMTPGEWNYFANRLNVGSVSLMGGATPSWIEREEDAAGISTLRNNAAAIARELARQAATIAEYEKEHERCRKESGMVQCESDEQCEGCGCRMLTPHELVAELRERAEKAEAERDAIAKRQRSDEDQLCKIAVMLSKDARQSNDGTIAGLVGELLAERDAALAKCRELEGIMLRHEDRTLIELCKTKEKS